ncbi:hypothetical protein [Actinacidiphila acidipaludis]|uniref:Lipoprotein n=1 Tax=Actinacidiphila acidipaludis TaxID=2873382 RepID=A0ABS7QAL9_9ACTN|nr:hypothetical protein [Streptomyces acidipaludis]MBY8880178.1 hypothetical protein [Streptomyces acidipaludis]
MRRIASLATAGALVCVCAVVAGCGTSVTGVRREGPAPTETVKPRSTTAPAIAGNPAALATMIRKDDSVSADVREDLTPCKNDDYPMDTDSGNLTSGDGPDLVVNIMTCGDGLGVASYVYRMVGGKYRCVFADEHSGVYGTVDSGRLQVIHEVYRSDDPVAYPTGEESSIYVWRADQFVQIARTYQDYGAKTPTASPEPLATDPVPVPDSDPVDPGLPSAKASGAPAGEPSPQASGGTARAPSGGR